MKKYCINYTDNWKEAPLAFWVHIPVEGEFYEHSTLFDPPAPAKKLKGYPVYTFELDGFTFIFSSIPQINHFVEIFSQKVMPTSRALSEKRGTAKGPNSHWLSRLPAKSKPYKYRLKLVEFIKKEMDG